MRTGDIGTNAVPQDVPLPRDPWRHRSTGMTCESCMWWVPKVSLDGHIKTIGRCRRHAPTHNGYPATFTDDWCGDHKLDEARVGRAAAG